MRACNLSVFRELLALPPVGAARQSCRMLPPGNAVWQRLGAGLVAAVMTIAPATSAAQESEAPAPAPTEGMLKAPLLDESHVTQTYGWIEYWIREGGTHQDRDDELREMPSLPATVPVTGCLGLKVTIRKNGILMGSAAAVFDDAAVPLAGMGEVRDLASIARGVTTEALAGVEQALGDAHLKAVVSARDPKHVPPRQTLLEVAPELLVDLQVGYGRESIRIGRTEEYHALFRNFAPGYHGLVMQGELKPEASWLWPASALASNVAPRSQLVQLLAEQGLKSDELVKVARPGGPKLDRFRVIHTVRPSPAQRTWVLTRGAFVPAPISLSRQSVDELATAMARHLERRLSPQGQIAGTYLPTSDVYDPAVSPDDERALALYALMRWTNAHPAADKPGSSPHRLAHTVVQVASDMAAAFRDDPARAEPAAIALTLLTLIESRTTTDRKVLRDALAGQIMSLRDDNGYFLDRRGERPRTLNHPTQALMANALTAMYEQTRQPELAEAANLNLAALWTLQQQTLQITSLPWLLMAELRLARLGADRAAADPAAQAQKVEYLGDLIDRLCRRQIVEPPEGDVGPDDVVGGFDLTGSTPQLLPVPDWRSAFVLSFVAEALRQPDAGLHEGRDRLGWLLTCGLTARFLAVLTFNEASSFYVRNPMDAYGGVRLAFWDNRLPAASTSISLIALTQLQESLSAAQGPTSPADPDDEAGGANDPFRELFNAPMPPEPAEVLPEN